MSQTTSLAGQAQHVADLLPGVEDARLDARTPCADYTVADLLQHLLELAEAFTDAAAKRSTPLTAEAPQPPGDALVPEWRTRLPERLTALADAWRDPGAWEGTTQAGGIELPGEQAGVIALNELLVHGWDLARATGQPYSADPAAVRTCLAFLDGFDGSGEEGLFGPRVPVPDTAPELDRVIGLSGRDPGWPGTAG
ncbi:MULTISPECIES: TIGR03086 family metal-binding protein [Streptomyces]|uniref:TIGR03086 family metal-binding protein n=1 Tax=Streptomyces TaxID=1883 RepID=UPI002248D809|nr:TIGR03086 family metal-binding protein [Streptomyces sp. JHD 1]MCX2970185.1 TIGR03086 family metal-binding protein [Streptomyces sp. JHD 1]